MKKLSTLLISVLLVNVINLYAQDDDCNRTKVAVSVEIIPGKDIYSFLDNHYGSRSRSEWNGFVAQMFVQILSEYEPEITFFSMGEGGGDYHYQLKTVLTLNVAGEEDNEHTVYWVTSSLIANANCIPNRNWIIDVELAKDPDLKQTLKNIAAQFQPMDRKIILYEIDHPSPPRDPELTIQIEKDYISPLDKESRTTKVNAEVYSCRGNQVCDIHGNGQPVYYQDNIDRLDLTIDLLCEGGYNIGNFMVIITNKQCNNEGKYKLEKGMEAEKKTILFKTCQLGKESYVEIEKELIIRGLEVKVKPERKEIYQEEETNIILSLNETDPNGDEEPVSGKSLKVKIEGLHNGEITPKSNYVTDSRGEVRLNYKAGDKDEKITMTASFQPEDYPDKAEGKGSVIIKPPEYDAAITITRTTRKEFLDEKHESKTDRDGCKKQTDDVRRIDENVNATIYVQCKLSHKADMPIFNQTWEYYQPLSANVSGFDITHMETHQMNGSLSGRGCANGGYETNVTTNYIVKEPEIYEPLAAMWIVAIDNETNKAVKIIPGGYSIEYNRDAIIKTESRQWNKDGNQSDNKRETKTTENLYYGVGPVEDPVPDPTFKPGLAGIWDYLKEEVGDSLFNAIPAIPIPPPSSEEVPEINPDLLVSYGDGIKSFGGSGSKEINEPRENGYERETHTYRWQMTRRKLNK